MNIDVLDCYDAVHDYIELQCLDDIIQKQDIAFNAYHNAIVIVKFYEQHGITRDFHDLIGDESLIDNARQVIENFITWLKDTLKKIVAFVLNLITKIKSKIMTILHVDDLDRLIKLGYDISTIEQKLFVILQDPIDFWINRPEQVELTERLLISQSSDLGHLLNTIVRGNAVTATRLKSHAEVICKSIIMLNQHLPDTLLLTDAVNQLNANDPSITHRVDRLIRSMCETLQHNYMNANDTIKVNTLDEKIIVCNTLLKLLLLKIKYTSINVSTLEGYLVNLRHAYMCNEIDIHLSFPISHDLCRRLGEYYGGVFKVNQLIVTNRDPRTWPDPITGVKSSITGWMFEDVPIPNIWCNYNFLMSSVSRWSRLRGSKEESLIKTIVHECRHLFDIQNRLGGSFTIETGSHEYMDRTYESRARYAADNYKPTSADIAFARMVLQKLDAEVRRQSQ